MAVAATTCCPASPATTSCSAADPVPRSPGSTASWSARPTRATVTFQGETAGYLNTVGWYKVVDGKIVDVQVLWANASLKGSGGSMSVGDSKPLDLQAGDQLGFFVVSNGASFNDFSKLTNGHFEFRDGKGNAATLQSVDPQLWFVDKDGKSILVKGDDYHSAAYGKTLPLNNDGILHTAGTVDAAKGLVHIGFEDLKGAAIAISTIR